MTTRTNGASRAVIVTMTLLGLAGCGEPAEFEEAVGAITAMGNCPAMTTHDVCICTGSSYTGTCALINPTQRFYSNLETVLSGTYGDAISSVIVGDDVTIKHFSADTYRGTVGTVIGPSYVSSLGANDNNISSIMVYDTTDGITGGCAGTPPSGKAYVYKDANFGGDCSVIKRLGQGSSYPNAGLNADSNGINGGFGLPHDVMSSIKVGANTKVFLYAASNFGNPSITVNKDTWVSNLGTYSMDNVVSSISIAFMP